MQYFLENYPTSVQTSGLRIPQNTQPYCLIFNYNINCFLLPLALQSLGTCYLSLNYSQVFFLCCAICPQVIKYPKFLICSTLNSNCNIYCVEAAYRACDLYLEITTISFV